MKHRNLVHAAEAWFQHMHAQQWHAVAPTPCLADVSQNVVPLKSNFIVDFKSEEGSATLDEGIKTGQNKHQGPPQQWKE